nr:UPF0236 family protein [Bacilliculturomica massiliensis]
MAGNETTQKRVREFGGYLLRHWEEIRRRRTEEVPGSCTEGQVSHLLSKRFSRDPMGWSRAGLGKLSRVRIYLKNGGKLTGLEKEREEKEQTEAYSAYAERMLSEAVEGACDWSIFSRRETVPFDQAAGTQQILHRLGSCRGLLN